MRVVASTPAAAGLSPRPRLASVGRPEPRWTSRALPQTLAQFQIPQESVVQSVHPSVKLQGPAGVVRSAHRRNAAEIVDLLGDVQLDQAAHARWLVVQMLQFVRME